MTVTALKKAFNPQNLVDDHAFGCTAPHLTGSDLARERVLALAGGVAEEISRYLESGDREALTKAMNTVANVVCFKPMREVLQIMDVPADKQEEILELHRPIQSEANFHHDMTWLD
jgi:hypothetical protein